MSRRALLIHSGFLVGRLGGIEIDAEALVPVNEAGQLNVEIDPE